MDLAYVDKVAKEKNCVKCLPVRQDVFGRTVNAKGTKTKEFSETVKAFLSMITKLYRPEKIWVDKGNEVAGAFKKFCTTEGIQVYSTMSVRLRLLLLNVQYDHWKIFFTVTWKILGTSIYTNDLNLSLP